MICMVYYLCHFVNVRENYLGEDIAQAATAATTAKRHLELAEFALFQTSSLQFYLGSICQMWESFSVVNRITWL